MRFSTSLVLLSWAVTSALGQDTSRSSTVTLSVGGAGGGYGGPAFNGNYEYRFFQYLAGEAGFDIMLPSSFSFQYVPIYSFSNNPSPLNYATQTGFTYLPSQDRNRVTMLPFGVKGILPLFTGRAELFLGLGGAYAWNARRYAGSSWLEQASLGGRIALDRQRRFWVGTTWRFFADLGNTNDRHVTGYNWFTGTADFTFRFGH